ncbi:hypothetical protein GJAV_G00183120 [Gymnothorax javanicus]|nr:hypothetical protein GJAV_G00183120 [Gymnothorax javanicus]
MNTDARTGRLCPDRLKVKAGTLRSSAEGSSHLLALRNSPSSAHLSSAPPAKKNLYITADEAAEGMWESCALSSILTSANWAVYETSSTEPQAAESCSEQLPPPAPVDLSSVYSTADGWQHKPPQQWTRWNILEWIGHHVEETQFDASLLDLARCSMDGPELCQLSRDTLLATFGSLGERLYQNLLELKAKYGEGDLKMTCNFLDSLFEGYPEILNVSGEDSSYDLLTSDDRSDYCSLSQNGFKVFGDMTPCSDNGYESGRSSPGSLDNSITGLLGYQDPNSPCSQTSDSDQDLTEEPFHLNSEKDLKRRRGRPKKQNSGSELRGNRKGKYVVRGPHLWEFIRDILIHPELNHGLMRWEDRREGVFKFLNSEAVAKLWGQKKRNSSMNYEKLSRAMRYYYKRQILERVDGRRLVYKFGKNSSGWRVDEAISASEPRNTPVPKEDYSATALERIPDDATGVSSTEPAGLTPLNYFISTANIESDDSEPNQKRAPRGAKGGSTKKRDQQSPFSHRYPRPHDPYDYFTTPTSEYLTNATYDLHDETGVTGPGPAGSSVESSNVTTKGRTRIRNPLYPLTESSYTAYAVMFLSLIVFAVGAVGNLAIMCIVWHNYYMKSAWNCILASLAFWDFLVLFFCLPLVIFNELTNKRLLGDFSCRIVPYMEVTSLAVTTFSLCALGIDRFQATASGQPKPRPVEPCQSILAKLGVIWVGSMVLAAPELLLWQLSQDMSEAAGGLVDSCTMRLSAGLPEWLSSLVLTYHDARTWWYFGCYFCLPIVFTLVCQLVTRHMAGDSSRFEQDARPHASPKKLQVLKRDRQLNCTVVALAVVYGICALPENVCNLVQTYSSNPIPGSTLSLLSLINQFFLFFKSSITPVLLLCLCKTLGQAFMDCCCCCCEECLPDTPSPSGSPVQGKHKTAADISPSIFFDKAKDSSTILSIGSNC